MVESNIPNTVRFAYIDGQQVVAQSVAVRVAPYGARWRVEARGVGYWSRKPVRAALMCSLDADPGELVRALLGDPDDVAVPNA